MVIQNQPQKPTVRTLESERERINAYRKTEKGAEYARRRNKINCEHSSLALACIREGKPIPAHLPQWCHELGREEKRDKVRANSLRMAGVIRAAVKHYRKAGFFADDTPPYALKAARNYLDARRKGAEVKAGVAIASWFYRQTMGKAIKARKAARNRIKSAISRRTIRAVKHSSSKDLGCNATFFKAYIGAMLKPGMTWENYGTEWHIDHVVPLVFAGDDVDGIRMLGDYRNLQPLWAMENMRKSDEMPETMTAWQSEAVRVIASRRAAYEPKA
jgi:hypothetical protein